MADYKVTDTELTAVANAIRTKGGTSADLEWYTGFVSAIGAISGGGSGSTNILSGTSAPISSQGSDGDIYLQYVDTGGYTLLEFLEVSSAGPYIRTGVSHYARSYFQLDANWTATPANNNALIGCGRGGGAEYLIQCWGNPYICAGTSHIALSEPLVRHTYRAASDGIYVDGDRVSTAVSWSELSLEIALFAMNWDNAIYKASNARIYACKIWDGNNLVRNFVPMERDVDGALGMFDLANGTFYVNAGSGAFTAGPDSSVAITSYTITHAYLKADSAWQNLIGSDISDVNTGGGVT